MTQISFEHQIAYLTAKIDIQFPNEPLRNGTGFFYTAPLNDGTTRSITLLISNRHVFLDEKGKLNPLAKWTISLNQKKTNDTPEFGNIIPFTQVGFGDKYFAHPDKDVDLACINVSGITHTNAFFLSLHDKFLTPINHEKVTPGSEVIFVGYPVGISDTVNNLPLIRKGFIASMPNVDFNGKGHIVIDAQIFYGSSGSPVFVPWDRKYSLLGVVSQTMWRSSGLEILSTNMSQNLPKYGVREIVGLGIVVKQRHVQELINYTVQEFVRRISSNS